MAPFDPKNDKADGPESKEELARMLHEYQKALEQEFDVDANPELVDPKILSDRVKKETIQHLPGAFMTMSYLSTHAISESVRFSAAKYLIEACVGKQAHSPLVDPLESVVDRLTPDRD